jgi:hypothetical protein
MALVDSALAANLLTIFQTMKSAASGTPKDETWLANQLAAAIDAQIKTASVTVAKGIAVSTTGTAAAQTGTTTATGSGTIS